MEQEALIWLIVVLDMTVHCEKMGKSYLSFAELCFY